MRPKKGILKETNKKCSSKGKNIKNLDWEDIVCCTVFYRKMELIYHSDILQTKKMKKIEIKLNRRIS